MKEKYILVLAADSNYINQAKALISSAVSQGKWKHDICIITDGLSGDQIKEFSDKGIYIKENAANLNNYYIKINIFSEYFKQWDKVLYVDCDILFSGDINCLMDINLDFMCEKELQRGKGYPTGNYFNKPLDPQLYEKIDKEYDLNQDSFNSCCILYNTNILKSGDKTFDDIAELKSELDLINTHNGGGGTDQPILNLYFQNIWKEFPDSMVTYWQRECNTSLILHFTHWFAPEKNNSRRGDRTIKQIHESNLSNFTKLSI